MPVYVSSLQTKSSMLIRLSSLCVNLASFILTCTPGRTWKGVCLHDPKYAAEYW